MPSLPIPGSCLPLLLGFILLLTGCGSGSKHPKTYPVSGELFVKGQPAAGARLSLHPEGADLSRWPRGFPTAVVEPDGKFQFSCFAEDDGAPEGSYKLLASWQEGDGIPNEDPAAPKPKNLLDPKYNNPATAVLSVTVEQKPNQIPRIEIP